MRALLEVCVGGVLGAVAWWTMPLADEGRASVSLSARQLERATATRPLAGECEGRAAGGPTPAQRQEEWAQQWGAFVETWGTPTQAPPGWDRIAEEARIREQLGAMPLDLVEVDCEFHPCVAVVAAFGEIDPDLLRAELGVGTGTVRVGEAWNDTVSVEVGKIAFVSGQLEGSQAKWARRLADRLGVQVEERISELLEENADGRPDQQEPPEEGR